MARPILDDGLWQILEPILPPPRKRRHRYPGRKPIEDRKALTGILFVLRTGIQWEHLPKELGCGCGMTCWRRLKAWQDAGVWEQLHKILLDLLNETDRIDWDRAVADSGGGRAVLGGRKPARIRRIGAGPAASTICSRMARVSHFHGRSPARTRTMSLS